MILFEADIAEQLVVPSALHMLITYIIHLSTALAEQERQWRHLSLFGRVHALIRTTLLIPLRHLSILPSMPSLRNLQRLDAEDVSFSSPNPEVDGDDTFSPCLRLGNAQVEMEGLKKETGSHSELLERMREIGSFVSQLYHFLWR